jgi:hypothetical protein
MISLCSKGRKWRVLYNNKRTLGVAIWCSTSNAMVMPLKKKVKSKLLGNGSPDFSMNLTHLESKIIV